MTMSSLGWEDPIPTKGTLGQLIKQEAVPLKAESYSILPGVLGDLGTGPSEAKLADSLIHLP